MSATTPQQAWGTPRAKTISWHDPSILRTAGADFTGREFLEAIAEGRLPEPPMAKLIGARLTFVGDGEARFVCAPDESAYNPLGIVHGGLLCTLLDFAAGAAVHTLLPADTGFSSIEIKVSYLKALRFDGGHIEAHGNALQVGAQVAFAEAHARNTSGDLVGHAISSIALLRPRS
jgi:uncharacterized protein (TIGR00369 family)